MVDRQASHAVVRAMNDRRFCEFLASRGPMSRAELAELAGVSKPAALQIINRLVEARLVSRVGTDERVRRGPSAVLFGLPDRLGLAIGVEVTGRHIRIGRRAMTGVDKGTRAVRLRKRGDLARQIVDAIDLGREDRKHRHRAVVLALPGAIDPATGDVLHATELPRWRSGISDQIRSELHADVSFENEVNLRATAEQETGCAQGLDDFLLLSVGQGVGAALMINGRFHRGAHGASGEVGFLPVLAHPLTTEDPNQPGDRYQAVAGGWDMAAAFEMRHTADYAWLHTLLADPPDDLIPRMATRIGVGLVGMITMADPAVVVLAGEVSRLVGEPLGEGVSHFLADSLPWPAPAVRVSELGDGAVLTGALLRAQHRLRDLAFPAR